MCVSMSCGYEGVAVRWMSGVCKHPPSLAIEGTLLQCVGPQRLPRKELVCRVEAFGLRSGCPLLVTLSSIFILCMRLGCGA